MATSAGSSTAPFNIPSHPLLDSTWIAQARSDSESQYQVEAKAVYRDIGEKTGFITADLPKRLEEELIKLRNQTQKQLDMLVQQEIKHRQQQREEEMARQRQEEMIRQQQRAAAMASHYFNIPTHPLLDDRWLSSLRSQADAVYQSEAKAIYQSLGTQGITPDLPRRLAEELKKLTDRQQKELDAIVEKEILVRKATSNVGNGVDQVDEKLYREQMALLENIQRNNARKTSGGFVAPPTNPVKIPNGLGGGGGSTSSSASGQTYRPTPSRTVPSTTPPPPQPQSQQQHHTPQHPQQQHHFPTRSPTYPTPQPAHSTPAQQQQPPPQRRHTSTSSNSSTSTLKQPGGAPPASKQPAPTFFQQQLYYESDSDNYSDDTEASESERTPLVNINNDSPQQGQHRALGPGGGRSVASTNAPFTPLVRPSGGVGGGGGGPLKPTLSTSSTTSGSSSASSVSSSHSNVSSVSSMSSAFSSLGVNGKGGSSASSNYSNPIPPRTTFTAAGGVAGSTPAPTSFQHQQSGTRSAPTTPPQQQQQPPQPKPSTTSYSQQPQPGGGGYPRFSSASSTSSSSASRPPPPPPPPPIPPVRTKSPPPVPGTSATFEFPGASSNFGTSQSSAKFQSFANLGAGGGRRPSAAPSATASDSGAGGGGGGGGEETPWERMNKKRASSANLRNGWGSSSSVSGSGRSSPTASFTFGNPSLGSSPPKSAGWQSKAFPRTTGNTPSFRSTSSQASFGSNSSSSTTKPGTKQPMYTEDDYARARMEEEAYAARKLARESSSVSSSIGASERIATAWKMYEAKWNALPNLGTIQYDDIPWPVLPPSTASASSTPNLSPLNVSAFLLSPHHSGSKSRKDRIKGELLRWHPDRFEGRFLSKVKGGEREKERVRESVGEVARVLSSLLGVGGGGFGD